MDKRTAHTEETYELECLLSSFLTYFRLSEMNYCESGKGNIHWSIQPDSINVHGSSC